jgi:hypothetical protein
VDFPRITTVLLCILFSAFRVAADEASPAVDFSEGLTRLAELGRTEIDEAATWVKIPTRGAMERLDGVLAKLKGNGWSLPSTADEPHRIVPLNPGEPVVIAKSRRNYPAADLEADVELLIANLHKGAEDQDDSDDMWGRETGGENDHGRLLIFASQIHQHGKPELANRLVTAIFQQSPDRRSVIDSAIHGIAGPLYNSATQRFFESGDWVAYHRDLQDLVTRFPRGWAGRRGVEVFLPQLEKQAAGETPAVPNLEGIPLNPAALAAIDSLITERAPQIDLPNEAWLLAEDPGDSQTPLRGVIACGIEALPVLAALLEDPYLVKMSNLNTRGFSFGSTSYEEMDRPISRGELAQRLLSTTLPSTEDDEFSDPATLRDCTLEFWREHRGKSREELALAFLETGSSNQKAEAARILAASSDADLHAKLESAILGADSLAQQLEIVKSYVQIRKTGAKSLLDAYAKGLREEVELLDTFDVPWEIRSEGVDPLIKKLEALTNGKPPRAIARDIGRGDPAGAEEAIEELEPLLEALEPRPRLHALLEGAFAAKDADVRGLFLWAAFAIDWEPYFQKIAAEQPGTGIIPERTISEAEANVWKTLIADQRPCKGDENYNAGVSTISELAALALEESTLLNFFVTAREMAAVTGMRPAEFASLRAPKRLAGEPIPTFPNPEMVAPERLQDIISTAAKLPALEIARYLATLSADERAAWAQWLAEPGEPALPPELRAHSLTILAVGSEKSWGIKDQSVAGFGPGFQLTKKSLSETIEAFANNAPAHSRTSVWIAKSPTLPGLEIVSVRVPLPIADAAQADTPEEAVPASIFGNLLWAIENAPDAENPPDAWVLAQIYHPSGNRGALWLQRRDGTSGPQDAEEADALFAILDAAEEDPSRFHLTIQVLSRADAAILNPE